MVTFLKNLALGLGKTALALILVFALFAGYGFYAEKSASRKAAAMCSSISAGADASTLRDLAVADGASHSQSQWIRLDGTDTLLITYAGVPPFSRHMCQVKAMNGRVTSTKLSRLD